MKILLRLLMLMVLLVSCEARFEEDVRVFVKGSLNNNLEEPISDAVISVKTRRSTGTFLAPGPSGEDEFILGQGISDDDGVFSFISILDQNGSFNADIVINDNFVDYSYSSSIVDYQPTDLTFDLGAIIIREKSRFNYSINRVSGPNNSISFSFKYQLPSCIEVFNQGILDVTATSCFEEFVTPTRTLNDNSPNIERTFSTIIGATVEFIYSINSAPEVTEIIAIDDDENNFQFEY